MNNISFYDFKRASKLQANPFLACNAFCKYAQLSDTTIMNFQGRHLIIQHFYLTRLELLINLFFVSRCFFANPFSSQYWTSRIVTIFAWQKFSRNWGRPGGSHIELQPKFTLDSTFSLILCRWFVSTACLCEWAFTLIKTYFPCFTLKHFLTEILFSVSKSCASFLNSKLSLLFGFIFLWRKTIFWNKSVIFGEYILWCWISLRRIGERGEGWRVRECFRNVALRKTQHLNCSNFNSTRSSCFQLTTCNLHHSLGLLVPHLHLQLEHKQRKKTLYQ